MNIFLSGCSKFEINCALVFDIIHFTNLSSAHTINHAVDEESIKAQMPDIKRKNKDST